MKNRARFNISSVIDEFAGVNNSILINDGDKTMYGTAIPYLYNLYSDLIVNPSTVSVSEFQKMAYTSPVIAVGLTILINLIKNEVGGFQHKNKKYHDFINHMIDSMDRSLDEIVTDMCTALWAGFYIGEKKYVSDGRYVYTKDIQPRPAQSILFRVDSQGKLKEDGIIQYYFNNLWTGYGNLLAFNKNGQPNPYASMGDFDYPWRTAWAQPIGTVIIPKSKCIHFKYKGLDGLDNPYGRSLLRPGYNDYLQGADMGRVLHKAANVNASPIPVVMVDPNQTNTEQGQSAFDDIADQLEKLGSSPGGSNYLLLQGKLNDSIWLDKLENSGNNLNNLVGIAEYFNKMQLTSVLFPSELAGLSDKGSYALGETQQDLLGRNVTSIVDMLKECLISQLVKPALEINFGEKEDFGSFEVVDNVAEDVALNMDKINTLTNLGYKLKSSAITSLLDLDEDAIESSGNPIIDNTQLPNLKNEGLASNFVRTTKHAG